MKNTDFSQAISKISSRRRHEGKWKTFRSMGISN